MLKLVTVFLWQRWPTMIVQHKIFLLPASRHPVFHSSGQNCCILADERYLSRNHQIENLQRSWPSVSNHQSWIQEEPLLRAGSNGTFNNDIWQIASRKVLATCYSHTAATSHLMPVRENLLPVQTVFKRLVYVWKVLVNIFSVVHTFLQKK